MWKTESKYLTELPKEDKKTKIGRFERITKRRETICCDGGGIRSSIPEELVYNILVCLPANVIFDVMRYVCRMWYNIIHNPAFISSHLKTLTGNCLIIKRQLSGYTTKMRKFDLGVQNLKFSFRGNVLASCNGFVLFMSYYKQIPFSLWVANPVTKQQVKLPRDYNNFGDCSFGYAEASGEYKVVNKLKKQFFILTIGVDKAWRQIDMDNCYRTYKSSSSLSLGGFVYWAGIKCPFVVCFDLETEIFQAICLPQGCEYKPVKLLAMGSCVSIMLSTAIDLWEVWLLMDAKTGEWEKLPDVNIQGRKYNHNYELPPTPTPVGWLQGGEILVFHSSFPIDILQVYNVKTGRIHSNFDLDSCKFGYHTIYGNHVNSLVRLPENVKHID